MDLLNDDQTSLTDGQTQDSHIVPDLFSAREKETEIVSELLDSANKSTPNPDGLKVSTYSDEGSQGFSLDDEAKDSSEPKSEALPLFPQLCQDFLPTLPTSSDVKLEPSFFLVKEAGSSGDVFSEDLSKPFPAKHPCFMRSLLTQSETLDSDAIVGSVSDLYIIEGDTDEFIISRSVDPSETVCPEYQSLSGAGVEKAEHDCNPHVLMCDSAVTQCHPGFSEEQALENNVSGMSQREELRPPAADAWEMGSMLVSDVRSATKETTQPQRDDSPVELWLDACQYLTGEDKEGQEVLVTADPVMQENQESGYYLNDSKRTSCPSDDIRGWGPPVERWSSVDSWASALSDWTGIIDDPSEDIAAAFAEIGAEIDALTQSLDELNSKTELEDLKTTVQEEPQEIMGVQGQLLKTKTIPGNAIHSDQSSLFLCLEATGPGTLDISGSRTVESCDITKGDQKPEELPSMGSVSVTVGSSGGYTEGVSLSIDSSCDGQMETFDDNVFVNNEDYPIKLKITEDTDLISNPELVYEETFGDELCQVTDGWSQQRSANEEGNSEGNTAGLNNLSAQHLKTPDPTQPDLYTDVSFNTFQDPLGERPVGSPGFIMCLAPISSDSSVVCQTNSSLEGDQTQNTSDHVQRRPLYPTSDGITDKPFLESDKELIHKRQNTINTAEESLPDGQQEEHTEEPHFLTDFNGDLVNYPLFPSDYFLFSETNRVACITLDLNDPFTPWAAEPISTPTEPEELKMPHKTPKNPPESKTRSRKEKSGHHHGAQGKKQETHHVSTQETCKQQENLPPTGENHTSENREAGPEVKEDKLVIETGMGVTEKGSSKPHGKKKKKHVVTVKSEGEPPVDMGSGAKPKSTKGRVDIFEAKLGTKTSKAPSEKKSKQPEDKVPQGENRDHKDCVTKNFTDPPNDDSVKRRRVSGDKFGKIISSLESKLPKTGASIKAKEEETPGNVGAARKKVYTEVVKEEIPPKEDPKVVQPIQAVSVSGDPQSLSLWCQFAAVHSDYIVTWSQEGKVLTENKRRTMEREYMDPLQFPYQPRVAVDDVLIYMLQRVKAHPGTCGAAVRILYFDFSSTFNSIQIQPGLLGEKMRTMKLESGLISWVMNFLTHRPHAGDESRVSLTITNASHKDLGKYQCLLSCSHGSASLDYLLTYEVLSEIVIPASPKVVSSASSVGVSSEEEDAHYSKLLFKEDFLSEQYFGENLPISIITEKIHFGEGMHRRAFRTKLKEGQIPLLVPGHSCVLKVHNAISYGTKNNDELIQRNFSLAVEECQVQNTAREYIKAYTSAARSVEAFGDIPEIIPIYLVHRPSNDVPYATLEEELIGDFVKYSVKDGKEINLMRRDSEAGQKCCAFQHWVYQNTEGNLLVTDMQGVGMKLTDVGIATCKKGYKGFKGNCATSFIDQFKALHQCNRFCEILGLRSLQPKAKKAPAAPKPKPQPSAAPKKKTFGPTVKGKS